MSAMQAAHPVQSGVVWLWCKYYYQVLWITKELTRSYMEVQLRTLWFYSFVVDSNERE